MKTKEINKLIAIHDYYLKTYLDIENLNQYASNKKFNENIDALKEYSLAHKKELELKLKAKQEKKEAKPKENKYDTAFENIFKESTGLLNSLQLNKIAKDLDAIKNEIVKPKDYPKGAEPSAHVDNEEKIIPPCNEKFNQGAKCNEESDNDFNRKARIEFGKIIAEKDEIIAKFNKEFDFDQKHISELREIINKLKAEKKYTKEAFEAGKETVERKYIKDWCDKYASFEDYINNKLNPLIEEN